MAISWKIDELRNTVAAQMAQIDRLDVAIDELSARAEAAEAQLAAVRQELEQAREYVDDALGDTNPGVPLVDRIVRLVSMLAANSTTPAQRTHSQEAGL
jgi:uncharacterized coiled-coil protein SlyX